MVAVHFKLIESLEKCSMPSDSERLRNYGKTPTLNAINRSFNAQAATAIITRINSATCSASAAIIYTYYFSLRIVLSAWGFSHYTLSRK